MTPIHAEASTIIDARPETIYAIIADYRVGHPAILPKPYFTGLTIEHGGQGAGTIIRVEMNVMGVKQVYREVVSEPQPGRILVEADTEAGVTSTFTVEPINSGQQTRVTIASDSRPSPGLKGLMERLFNPPIIRRIFQQELQQLAAYAQGK